MKSIVLCGGGTAGHIMPNVALLPALRKHFDKIYYFGQKDSLEEKIAKENHLEFFATECVKFDRANILKNFNIPLKLFKGISSAKSLLKKLSPSVVFSKGGFASLPTVLGAKKLDIPYVIHESDASLGLANKLCVRSAKAVLCAYENNSIKDSIYVGNPLRSQIFTGNSAKLGFSINKNLPTVLVVGGSLGARAINMCVAELAPHLCKSHNLIHIVGKGGHRAESVSNYFAIDFADNIQDYFSVADVIVSRCGAIASAEILALGKKAVFIPLPSGASRGDQEENAEIYAKNNQALILKQEDMTCKTLLDKIETAKTTTFSPFDYDRRTPEKIVEILLSFTK